MRKLQDETSNGTRGIGRLRLIEAVCGVIAGAAVTPYFFLALFTHPGTDDFCHIATVHQNGYLRNQINWYYEWSGRFFATAAFSLWGLATNLRMYYFVGLFVLTALFFATWLFVRTLSPSETSGRILFRTLSVFAVLVLAMPVPNQTIYWLSGAFTYQLGNVVFLLLLATLLRSQAHPRPAVWRPAIAVFLSVAAVGANESNLAVVVPLLAVGAVWHRFRRRDWTMSLIAALIAAIVVLASPGNAIRSADYPMAHQLSLTLLESMKGGVSYVVARLFSLTGLSGLILVLPWAVSLNAHWNERSDRGRAWSMLALAWILLFPAVLAPAWWGLGEASPERAMSVPLVVFIAGGLALVAPALAQLGVFRSLAHMRWLRVIAVATLAYGLWSEGWIQLAIRDIAQGNAARYHRDQVNRLAQVDAYVERRVETPLVEPIASSIALSIATVDIGPDPKDWINACYADFYGFREIALVPSQNPK